MTDSKDYFVHAQGICESPSIGKDTRIWAFAHVLPGARIGSDCNICDHVFIENDVVLGDRVTVKCGVQIWDGITLKDDVFIGPNVSFSNDPFPRSKKQRDMSFRTLVSEGASIGSNATILPGLTIGRNAMIGAGSVVTHSVPANAIVIGNPARIVGYADSGDSASGKAIVGLSQIPGVGVHKTRVNGVALHVLPLIEDLRGNLTVGEIEKDIPFPVKRYFMVYDVPSAETRGAHAHKSCHQFLISAKGRVSVLADDGKNRQEFLLDKPNHGLFLSAGTWSVQYKYSPDAVLLVFASMPYDPDDYVRDYEVFRTMRR